MPVRAGASAELPMDDQGEIDWVMLASMQSFPASDAPAYPASAGSPSRMPRAVPGSVAKPQASPTPGLEVSRDGAEEVGAVKRPEARNAEGEPPSTGGESTTQRLRAKELADRGSANRRRIEHRIEANQERDRLALDPAPGVRRFDARRAEYVPGDAPSQRGMSDLSP